MIGSLSEKIENLRASRGDSDVLRQIEDRIGLLSHKLGSPEAKAWQSRQHRARDEGTPLAYLENTRSTVPPVHVAAAAPPVENLAHDVIRTQESLEAAHGTIGDVVDRLAMIETGMRTCAATCRAGHFSGCAADLRGTTGGCPMPGSKSAIVVPHGIQGRRCPAVRSPAGAGAPAIRDRAPEMQL